MQCWGAIREAIPDANSQSPQAVLEYVRDTLRADQAKTVGATVRIRIRNPRGPTYSFDKSGTAGPSGDRKTVTH